VAVLSGLLDTGRMPEGDTVRRTAQRLDAALAGSVLVRAELRWPSVAGVDLRGRQVLHTASVGKHLLTRFGATASKPALTLHSHLRMDGSWRTWAAGTRAPAGARSAVRAVLANTEWMAVGLQLGMLDLVPTAAEHRLVGHLGPDVLGAGWDPDEAMRRLASEPARNVGAALLDQRLLAGLGTYWVSESLFLQGISPRSTVAQADGLSRLVARLPLLLGAERRPEPAVYGRAAKGCRRCGTPVRTISVGVAPQARVLHYCPRCQADRPGSELSRDDG
jgi:endonuclease-8